jgi:hypothetical protein
MQTKLIGYVSLLCLVLTVIWLALLITGMAGAGPLDTFERTLAYVKPLGVTFYLTYLNAALITVMAVMLFALLYRAYQSAAPEWAITGLAFVPIYGAMNLCVYLSQVTVVPQLLQLQSMPEYQTLAPLLLRQTLQIWPYSAVATVNNLAYAVLGIPSLIFGGLMLKANPTLRFGGILLGLSGLASIAGFIGIVAQISWLSQGSLVGGVLFLLALGPVSWAFLRTETALSSLPR